MKKLKISTVLELKVNKRKSMFKQIIKSWNNHTQTHNSLDYVMQKR